MQLPVNVFSKLFRNTFNRSQFFNTGIHHASETTKARQELLAALGAYTLDLFQSRGLAGFGALGTHAGNGKTVCLVADLLHQVRAHLAAIGAPIVGDVLYGGAPQPGLGRFFLHAASLGVRHPMTGDFLRVESPLPPELQAVLDARIPG
jgi:hypothetical protein